MYQNLHVLMIATTVCFLPVLSGCDDSKDSGISSCCDASPTCSPDDVDACVDMRVTNQDRGVHVDASDPFDATGPDVAQPLDLGGHDDLGLEDARLQDSQVLDAQVSDMNRSDAMMVDQFVPPSVEPCKLPFSGGTGVGVGMPQPEFRMPAVGDVTATVLFVDFPDYAAVRTTEDVFSILSPEAEAMFEIMSYGRLRLTLVPHRQWLRLSEPAQHYANGLASFQGHKAFIEEAVRLADDAVDFSNTDVVVVLAAPSATPVGYGPTWTGSFGTAIVADGRRIANAVTSGQDLLFWGSPWLNHELGHSMGLPDSYSYEGAGGFTRPFSLMDLINSVAPEFLAWERWQLGWLDDEQVRCNVLDRVIELTPIENPGGTKAVVLPVNETERLVLESRRALGYDARLSTEGVVISRISTQIRSGYGPIRAENNARPLTDGQQLTLDGYQIEVVESNASGDRVIVTQQLNGQGQSE